MSAGCARSPLLIAGLVGLACLPAASVSARRVAYLTHGDGRVSVIRNYRVKTTFPAGHQPWFLAFSPDGSRLYVTDRRQDLGYEGDLLVIDTATNAVLATVPIGDDPGPPAVHPNGSRVYVASADIHSGADAKVTVVDTATYATSAVAVPEGAAGVAVAASGTRLYVTSRGPLPPTGSANGAFTAIDTATNTVLGSEPAPFVDLIALHPDGTRAYGTSHDRVYVFDTGTLTVTGAIPVHDASFVTVHPDGTELYVTNLCGPGNAGCPDPGVVTVVSTATNAVQAEIPVGRRPQELASDPRGRRLYVANGDDLFVSVIKVGCTPREVHRIPTQETGVGVRFAPCPRCRAVPRRRCR